MWVCHIFPLLEQIILKVVVATWWPLMCKRFTLVVCQGPQQHLVMRLMGRLHSMMMVIKKENNEETHWLCMFCLEQVRELWVMNNILILQHSTLNHIGACFPHISALTYCGSHMDHTQIRPLPSPMHHTWTTPKLGPYQAPIIRRANWSGRTPSMLRVVYKM